MVKQQRSPLVDAHVVAVLQHDRWMTRKDIATALGYTGVHPALIDKIEGLVTEGMIERFEEELGRHKTKMWYSTTPDTVRLAQEALQAQKDA